MRAKRLREKTTAGIVLKINDNGLYFCSYRRIRLTDFIR